MKPFVFLIFTISQILVALANAASVEELDLSQMSVMADSIIVGRCTAVQPEWRGGKIFTKTTVQIDQHIKGNGNNTMEITSLGGTAIHPTLNVPVTMSVGGGLSFQENEEVVLFTKRSPQGMHQVIGMSLGKFEVKTERETRRKLVPLSQKKLDMMPPGTFTPRAKKNGGDIEQSLKPRDMDLNEFIQKIRDNIPTEVNRQNN